MPQPHSRLPAGHCERGRAVLVELRVRLGLQGDVGQLGRRDGRHGGQLLEEGQRHGRRRHRARHALALPPAN